MHPVVPRQHPDQAEDPGQAEGPGLPHSTLPHSRGLSRVGVGGVTYRWQRPPGEGERGQPPGPHPTLPVGRRKGLKPEEFKRKR